MITRNPHNYDLPAIGYVKMGFVMPHPNQGVL